jgi:hypothetical protein
LWGHAIQVAACGSHSAGMRYGGAAFCDMKSIFSQIPMVVTCTTPLFGDRTAEQGGIRKGYFGTFEVSAGLPGLYFAASCGVDTTSSGFGLSALAVSTAKT